MGKTITQKLIEAHLVSGRIEPGSEIGIRIDQTLTQDATGTMAYLQFEAMGIDRVRTELSDELHRPQHDPDRLRERRRPPLPAVRGAPLRHPALEGRKRHLPPGPPGALRKARKDAAGLRQPHLHLRGPGHACHRRGRPRRGARHGRRAVLPHLPEGDPGQPDGKTPPLGLGQGRHPQAPGDLHDEGQRGPHLRIRRRGPGKSHGTRAGHHRQHGGRAGPDHLRLPERRDDAALPGGRGAAGRLGGACGRRRRRIRKDRRDRPRGSRPPGGPAPQPRQHRHRAGALGDPRRTRSASEAARTPRTGSLPRWPGSCAAGSPTPG